MGAEIRDEKSERHQGLLAERNSGASNTTSRSSDASAAPALIATTDRSGFRENRWQKFVRSLWCVDRMHLKYLDVAPFGSDIWKDVKALLPPVTDPLYTHIAGIARVPADGLARLQKGVALEIEREWRWQEQSRTTENRKARKLGVQQTRRLARLSGALCIALESLNSEALASLAYAAMVSLENDPPTPPVAGGPDFRGIQRSVSALAKRASRAADLNRPKPSLNPVGRKARGGFGAGIGPGSLPVFTLRLLWDVRAAGGRLTLDKNSGKGTLPETLELLSPHLPPGFIPRVLPLSTLARMKALEKKLAVIQQEEPNF